MIRIEASHTAAAAASSDRPFELVRDAFGKLHYSDADGRSAAGVSVVRAFPLSEPDRWIAICDRHGSELALLSSLADLPEAKRKLIEDELAQREFTPVILRVYRSSGLTEPCEWDVETDRGRTQLVLKSEDDIRRLGPHGALIRDAVGVRYLIPDSRTLDAASRQIVERYL
jgi:hypothetical protein